MVVVLLFVVIAFLRVIQKIAYKNSSMMVQSNIAFFRFGTIYQFIAGLLSAFAFVGYGVSGFNAPTVVCSLIMAVLFAVDLYSGIETVKEAPLIVVNIYSLGGLILSCILSYFMFGEKVSIFQGLGLVMFFVGVYLLTPSGKKEKHRLSGKTIFLLFVSFFANGFVMVTQKYFSLKVVDGNTAMFSFLTFMFNSAILFIFWMYNVLKEKKQLKNGDMAVKEPENTAVAETSETPKKHKTFLGMEGIMYFYGGIMALAVFGINIIITELGKTVSAVILFPTSSAIAIIVTVIIGRLVYKEKISKKAFVGLIFGFLSIIVIGTLTPEVVSSWF